MNKTNKGLLALLAVSAVVYFAYKQSFKDKKTKKLGDACNNFGSGPDGIIVYDFPLGGTNKVNMIPEMACKRCNDSGCRQITL